MIKNQHKIKIAGKERIAHFGLGFVERVIEKESPEDNDIMQVSTAKLLFHALAYTDDREERSVQLKYYDVIDFLDEVGLHSEEVKSFQASLFKSLKNHLPTEEAKKSIDELVKSLSPEEKKKETSKSGTKK